MKNLDTRKEKVRKRSSLWYYENKDNPGFKERAKESTKSWRERFPKRYLLQHAKSRAKMFNKICDLTEDDIVIPRECPVLKVPFKYGTRYAMSVDRIDPKGNYVKDNIQIISRKANTMKQDATIEELRNFAQWANTFQI